MEMLTEQMGGSRGRAAASSKHAVAGAQMTFWLVVAMLVFAPLIRGGNRPLPLIVLELCALVLIGRAVLRRQVLAGATGALYMGLAGLALLPLLQLVPLPAAWGVGWAGLPHYADAAAVSHVDSVFVRLSVVPLLTEASWLALLPPLAVFVVTMSLRGREVERLVLVFVAMACVQAVLALLQFGAGPGSLLRLGMGFHHSNSGVGTYPSRNNLAGMLAMALPIVLALLAASVFRLDRDTRSGRGGGAWWSRIKALGSAEGQTNRTVLYAAVCLVVLLGLAFSRSRMGIAMGMLGLVLATLALARNFGGRFSANLVGILALGGGVLAATAGLAPVLARFGQDPMADGRWAIYSASWRAAQDFFPFGSGAGTYVEVISAYHPREFDGESYINHAHNDYLEWLVEGGGVAVILMLIFAFVYLLRWRQVWAVRNWQSLHAMQVGAGVGLFVLMVHGLTDYNLRIPANQIYFALLAGVFMHPGSGSGGSRRSSSTGERRRSVPPESATVSSGHHRRDDRDGGDVKVPIAKPGNNPFAG